MLMPITASMVLPLLPGLLLAHELCPQLANVCSSEALHMLNWEGQLNVAKLMSYLYVQESSIFRVNEDLFF